MSDQNDSAQEKTHEPTARRLDKAREEGNVPQSQDTQTLAGYLGFSIALALGGAWVSTSLGETLMAPLAYPEALSRQFLGGGASDMFMQFLGRIGGPALILVALPAGFILALLFAQRAVIFAPGKIEPKLSRISIIANARQKYGPKGLFEFAKSAVKVTALSTVLALVLLGQADRIPRYAHIRPRQVGMLLEDQFWSVMTGVLIVAAVVAFADLLWQRRSFHRDNMMTHDELKEETRQSEGDPHIRASRRDRARQIANNRMLHDVPRADVVIVNPTHYAVALKWDRTKGSVPRCLAKGVDQVALSIRHRAEVAGVPVHEDPPTARALHGIVSVGEEIRPEHYKAVAAAIVFADRVRARTTARAGESEASPGGSER